MRFELRGLVAIVKPVECRFALQRVQHAHTIAGAELRVALLFAGYLAFLEEDHFPCLDRRRRDLREQPDAPEQQRLVDQVESQAVAADEGERPGPASRCQRGQPRQQAGGGRKLCRGDAEKHGAEPGKQRHVIVGARVDRRQADPPQRRMIEGFGSEIDRPGDHHRRHDKRQQGRQPQEQKAEQAGQRDLMQDAEEDEAVRRDEVRDRRYSGGRDGDHGKTFPEAGPADLPAMREKQADADQEQEGRGDAARIDLPPADGGEAGIGVVEIFEIPGEVVARHGDQRDAAYDIDGDDALRLISLQLISRGCGMDAHGLAI